jgi:diacylglycerol kinase family enzyme
MSFVSSSSDRVLVVANPGAGARPRSAAIEELCKCLTSHGLLPQRVTDLEGLGPLAAHYHAAGQLRAIVAAGGDGTAAEIVNRTAPDVPVCVYPLGTANLLASYFHLQRDPEACARTLLEGATVRLDAGSANGRIFLLMAGCGFDAEVVHRVHRKRNGSHISYWTYARPILESIRSYRYPKLRIYHDSAAGDPQAAPPHEVRWAFVVNLPCYAGGLQLAPEAIGTDGLLNASTFRGGSFWHALRYLSCIALGQHRLLTDFRSSLVTRARIEADEQVPYQLDGDPGGVLPLSIEVVPERWTLVAPLARLVELNLEPARRLTGAR